VCARQGCTCEQGTGAQRPLGSRWGRRGCRARATLRCAPSTCCKAASAHLWSWIVVKGWHAQAEAHHLAMFDEIQGHYTLEGLQHRACSAAGVPHPLSMLTPWCTKTGILCPAGRDHLVAYAQPKDAARHAWAIHWLPASTCPGSRTSGWPGTGMTLNSCLPLHTSASFIVGARPATRVCAGAGRPWTQRADPALRVWWQVRWE